MGRPLRMYSNSGTYFVTTRTTQGRLLLRPSEETNLVVGGVLAQAVAMYGIDLHAYVITSNHLHLLCTARGNSLSAFMQYLKGNVARKVGRLIGWRGTFWEQRFTATEVLDEFACLDRLKYVLAHGVKEGLVRRVFDWPGLHCARHLLDEAPREFFWFDWTRRWAHRSARAATEDVLDLKLARSVVLTLTPLPMHQRLSPNARRDIIRTIIEQAEAEAREQHGSVLGVRKVLAQSPRSAPARMSRRPRPLCHATSRVERQAYRERYRSYVASFSQASKAFRSGSWAVPFPEFACRPPCLQARLAA